MPRIGFFVKAGRHFVQRMETHKFVNTNLLTDPYPIQLESQFASRIAAASAESNTKLIFYPKCETYKFCTIGKVGKDMQNLCKVKVK